MSQKQRKATAATWKVDASEEEIREAVEAFRDWASGLDDGLRDPLAVFLKDPARWIPERSALVPPAPPVSSPEAAPIAPAAPKRDSPGIWNRIVTANPYEWNGHAPRRRLAECEADPVFVEKWQEVCQIAQKIHEVRGTDAGWITLPWALAKGKDDKPPGWYRLLTEFQWMTEAPGRKPAEESIFDRVRRELLSGA